ncbi:hypothetical protein [Segetibacter koreensis]|uniref:hypothetical protein n=1 Tax=Segetibacter koreensis TaxID=398037 RepID=UPI00036BDB57|nr:hypothetical protein [Segetibacter koreensis]
MRKLFTAVVLALTIATSAFAAGGNKVNFFAQNSFESEFKNASNVQWTSAPDFLKATFVQNNQKKEAFYNSDGQLIATSRTADLSELPVKAKRTFAKKLEGYTVKEAIRFEGIDENAYYISAENEKGSVIFKIEDNGFVTVKKA